MVRVEIDWNVKTVAEGLKGFPACARCWPALLGRGEVFCLTQRSYTQTALLSLNRSLCQNKAETSGYSVLMCALIRKRFLDRMHSNVLAGGRRISVSVCGIETTGLYSLCDLSNSRLRKGHGERNATLKFVGVEMVGRLSCLSGEKHDRERGWIGTEKGREEAGMVQS